MQTRCRAKVQSLSSPVSPLENSGTRPPSSASDEEGDLGLATMLGEGAVSDVGGGSTCVGATSELGNTTIIAAQAPAPEANVATSLEHVGVDGADPLLSVVSTTRLPATCTQAPVGSLQAAIPSSGRGGHQCISPRFITSVVVNRLGSLQINKTPLFYWRNQILFFSFDINVWNSLPKW